MLQGGDATAQVRYWSRSASSSRRSGPLRETAREAAIERPESAESAESAKARLAASLIALVLVASALFQLHSRPLFDPDEGRNAEVMREMAVSSDLVVPRLNGLPFLDKPFLYFAAGGLAARLLGATELAVRLPAFLCTVGTLFVTWRFARGWLGRDGAGAQAAAALGASAIFLAYSQIVIFDAMLTLWITVAAMALHHAVEAEARGRRVAWAWIAWAAMALGILTKGPVALLVPLVAAIPWAIWRRRFSALFAWGAPLAIVPLVGPWLWAVLREDPRFLHYVLFTETLGRMSADNALRRDAPIWYYLPILLLGALPWTLVPIAGWRELRDGWREREPTLRFLLAWFAIPFVFFSLLHSKRPHYILPILPALALISVWIWRRRAAGEPLPGARAGALLWFVLGATLTALGAAGAAERVKALERFDAGAVSRALAVIGAAWIVAAAIAWLGRRSTSWALFGFALPVVALIVGSAPILEKIGEDRSAHRIAQAIEAAQPAGGEVVGIETIPPSLPFYLGRTITLVSSDGDPLRSNYLLGRYDELVDRSPELRSPEWLASVMATCDASRLFLTERRHDKSHDLLIAHGFHLLAETSRHRLYGGCDSASADRRAEPDGAKPPGEPS